jgi:hypothetical protein
MTSSRKLRSRNYLTNRLVPNFLRSRTRLPLRANGAEHAIPGQRPGGVSGYIFRPARAERSCALAGRSGRFRNPGRCPGLEFAGAFSAGVKVEQFQIHDPWCLAIRRWRLGASRSLKNFRVYRIASGLAAQDANDFLSGLGLQVLKRFDRVETGVRRQDHVVAAE